MTNFPRAPKHLRAEGKEAWALGKVLWEEGTLQERDLVNWTLFAEAVQEKADCVAELKNVPEYSIANNGCYVLHPAVKRRQQCENVIRKYSVSFGLLPTARKSKPTKAQVSARKR